MINRVRVRVRVRQDKSVRVAISWGGVGPFQKLAASVGAPFAIYNATP